MTAASAMIGAPSAPKETGALLAIAATRIALRSEMPSEIRMGATTAHGYPKPTRPSSSAPNAQANSIVCTRTSMLPCAISQRRKFSNTPLTPRVLNSTMPQTVIQSTLHTPVAAP